METTFTLAAVVMIAWLSIAGGIVIGMALASTFIDRARRSSTPYRQVEPFWLDTLGK